MYFSRYVRTLSVTDTRTDDDDGRTKDEKNVPEKSRRVIFFFFLLRLDTIILLSMGFVIDDRLETVLPNGLHYNITSDGSQGIDMHYLLSVVPKQPTAKIP